MNALPPELLSSIIESATECSSIYDSWNARVNTLLSLTLVNRQFHQIAQPLLSQQLYFVNLEEVQDLQRSTSLRWVQKVADEAGQSNSIYRSLSTGDFARLEELRVRGFGSFPLSAFNSHSHLQRLALEMCDLFVGADYDDFVLSGLQELSIKRSQIYLEGSNIRNDPFFTTTRFPYLRALGIKALACMLPGGEIVHTVSTIVSPSLLPQLDCMTVDKIEPRVTSSLSPSPPPPPVPVLFDLDPRHTATSWGCSSLAPNSSLSHSHIRIRLPCEPIPHRRQIEAALFLVETLLNESTVLEELYLDLYPRDGRRGYELDEELQERIRKLEDPNRKTKVEIIWENHEDDWCRSRVSKEFWRRCKARKKRAEQGEEMSTT